MILLKLDFLTAGLNGDSGLIRQHFREAAKVKMRLKLLMLSQRPKGHITIDKPVRITYTRYCNRFMDWDNAVSSFKHIGDAIVDAGIIADDSPKIIQQFIPRQIQCKKADERTEILIELL